MIIHQQAVLLAIVLEPGILEPRVKLVNTVELQLSADLTKGSFGHFSSLYVIKI